MSLIAVLVDNDYEDSELRVPYDRLREAGHKLTLVGKKAGETVKGKKGTDQVTIEKAAAEVKAAEFDALLIPGGYSPDKLRLDEKAVALTRAMGETGKLVAAICHAPSLLIDANLVRGRRVTSWPSIKQDLVNAGARWEDREVLEDGNLITSRKPADLDAFCEAILGRLGARTSRL